MFVIYHFLDASSQYLFYFFTFLRYFTLLQACYCISEDLTVYSLLKVFSEECYHSLGPLGVPTLMYLESPFDFLVPDHDSLYDAHFEYLVQSLAFL